MPLTVLAVLILAGQDPTLVPTGAVAAPLVLDQVTVVDVERGTLLPEQRVVITKNRIQAVGPRDAVQLPPAAQVVNAQGKYLIPGLWDMHYHYWYAREYDVNVVDNPLMLANGITGMRDPGTDIPLDTLRRWQQEMLAGTRAGPPRQILSAQAISGPPPTCDRPTKPYFQTCVVDVAEAVRVVDSLKAAGADMIKPRELSRALYFAIAAEARRLHMPFGGHAATVTAVEASDSGAILIDHMDSDCGTECPVPPRESLRMREGLLFERCLYRDAASLERCQPLADRLRRNGTWWVLAPLLYGVFTDDMPLTATLSDRLQGEDVWSDSVYDRRWFRKALDVDTANLNADDPTVGKLTLAIVQRVGLPILAGTDVGTAGQAGFRLHAELAAYVAEGLTPLTALQSATLNPAKMLNATDSLGTVATGKLADLVLLEANPLANIGNTTTIWAVIANGYYYDRAKLDRVLAKAQAEVKKKRQTSP